MRIVQNSRSASRASSHSCSVKQEFTVPFCSENGEIHGLAHSEFEFVQAPRDLLHGTPLCGFVANDSPFSYMLAAGLELRLHQHNNGVCLTGLNHCGKDEGRRNK